MKFINDVSNDSIKSRKSTKLIFDSKACLIENEDEAYAKTISVDIGNGKIQRKYYIRTYNNAPFDPIGAESRRNVWPRTDMKIVSNQTFDYYLSYLQTKNGLFLTKTNRSFIDG